MASKSTATQDGPQYTEKYNPVKSLLISQPKPEEKSPYYELEQKMESQDRLEAIYSGG
jgi:hypothetical protein